MADDPSFLRYCGSGSGPSHRSDKPPGHVAEQERARPATNPPPLQILGDSKRRTKLGVHQGHSR
eukprot:10295057-Lingulodinium_polyedra.AAC.1